MKNFILRKAKTGLLFLFFGLIGQSGWGQTNYVSWDFTTPLSSGSYDATQANMDGVRTTQLTNATFTGITCVGVSSANNSTTLHRSTGWPGSLTTIDATATKYTTFSITLDSGQTFPNSTLSLNLMVGNSSNTTAPVRLLPIYGYGDSPTYASIGSIITINGTQTQLGTITIPAPGNTTTTKLTVRIAGYNTASGTTGNMRLSKIALTGANGPILSPSITIGGSTSATATAFTTTYGTASTNQSFTIAGSDLTADISVAALTGFEYSIDGGSTWGTTRTITQSSGSASATLRVRLVATAAVSGSYNSQSINLSSTGATTRTISTASSGNTVSKKALTITAANQSVAYGTAVATVTGNGSYTSTGFVNSETSSVIGGSATYTTTYTTTTAAGSNVATITPVTSSLTATNYSFTAANGNISVTAVVPLAPTITGITSGNNQLSVAFTAPSSNGGASITNYDYSTDAGTNWTTPSPAVTTSPFTISGLTNDTTYNVQIRAFNSAGSGTASTAVQGTPTAPTTPTIIGAATATAFTTTYGTASAAQSFAISGSALDADIIATAPTGFEVSSDGSSYNSTATFTQSGGSASGTLYIKLAATATVSGTYNSQNIVLSSIGASDVNISTSSTGNTVSQKALAITTATVASKVYNRSLTSGTVTPGTLSGFVGSETVVVSSAVGTYADWNVGTGKSATIVYTLANGTNGGLATNYTLANTVGTGNITGKALTITSPAVTSKTYDGNTTATISGTLSGVESADAVTLIGTGTFASANAGIGISVTSTSTLGGADAGNYALTQPTELTGDINTKGLTITANDVTKESGQILTGGSGSTAFTSSGLVSLETIGSVTISYGAAGSATGDGATNGTYANQVIASAATAGTFNSSNYTISYVSGSIIVSGFSPGNIVVNRIGNGSTTLTSAASSINVLELNTSGITQQTISTLFTGSNLLTETGSGTSNGHLNSYNTSLGVSGYNSALGTASVNSSNTKATNILGTGATVVNRVVFPTSGSPLPFTGDNFRSIIPTSLTTFYASGNGSSLTGGIWYYNGTSYTQVSTTQTNTRNVEIFNGNLYFSTGSGTKGIYQVGSGLPTASGQTATLIAAATSPYGFSISPDGNTMYVADDGTVNGNTGGGIQKWTKSGGTWTRQYTFAVQARGITVDYSGNNPIIFATTVVTSLDNNKIIKIEDTGSSASSSDVLSAGTNYVFRGIDFSPAAAPVAPTIGTVTQTTCSTATGSVELTGLPSGQWRIYGFPSGSAVGTGSSTTISGLSAGSYTFLVTSYTGRTSEVSASVTINAQPGAPGYPSVPSASAQSFCSANSPTVASLVATGTAIKWYDASSNGNLLASGTALSAGTYYASQTVSGCESTSRTAATVSLINSGTWTGGSSSWSSAANWCGGIPTASTNVVISNGNPILDVNHTIASGSSLTLSGTATLTINPDSILTVAGTADFGGKSVILKSDASGDGAIGQVTGSLTGATNVTVERYIPAKRAWRALTAPLKGSNTSLYASWQNGGVAVDPFNTGIELWGPNGTGSSGNGLASGAGYSIRQYTSSGWADVTNTQSTNLFTSGSNNAYLVFVTGGYGSNNIGNGLSAATTLKATGQLITGPVSFAVTSARHTLVGNPFASPISPSAILAGNTQANLYTNIWLWDPAVSTNGVYVNYDASVNSGTFSDISGSYTTSSTAIQSGQAFFVKAVAGTDTLTLTESMKSSSISNTFRNNNNITASVVRVGFAKQIGIDWMPLDGAIAALYNNANAAVDVADGTKMVNTSENIAFVRGTTNLSIEHYPIVNATDQLNVKIWNTQQAHYKLKLNTEEFTMVGVEAYLQDLYTGTTQPLNLDGSVQDYEFDVDPTVSASSGNRFRIVFTNTALAVTHPEQGQLSIYPNPATGGKVTVSLPTGNFEGCSYELINVLGQVVRQDQIENGTTSQVSIPITGLPNSWYALRITKDNSVLFQGKLIIKN